VDAAPSQNFRRWSAVAAATTSIADRLSVLAVPLSNVVPSLPALALDRRSFALGVVGGIGSLALVGGLWLWFGFTTRVAGNVLFLAYVALGALVLGAVPTLLFVTRRLVTPVVVVSGIGVVVAARTWLVYVAPQTPPAPVGPTPVGWSLLGWPAVAAVALAAGGVELRFRAADSGTGTPAGE
jgi:hypothetical protein